MNNFDENGFATKDTRIKVYNYSREDYELISSSYEHVVMGSGIPALATLVRPLSDKDDFTQVFNEEQQKWSYVEDHRYEDVYNIYTKQKEEIRYIGTLKEEHTLLEPPSFYHDFIDGVWIISAEKQAEIDAVKTQQRISELEAEKAKLSADMQMHLLLDEKDEAKAIALQIKEINAEIEKLEV